MTGVRGDGHVAVPIFDGHNDLATALRWPKRSGSRDFWQLNVSGHLDLPRMRRGGMVGGFFSAFVPSKIAPNEFTKHMDESGRYQLPLPEPLVPDVAFRHVLGMLMLLHRIADASAGAVRIARSVDDVADCMREEAVAVALHVEGADAVDSELEALEVLHRLGVRAIAPVWSRPNAFGHGVPLAFPSSPDVGPGLTDAGKRLVAGCGELGMLVDVSHLTEAGFWDVMDVAEGPVVASHSNAHAICPHARNLTDGQLDALAERGGLVGVNFGVGFLASDGSWDPGLALDNIARHVDHLVMRMGERGVGFGSDFEGARIPDAIGSAEGLPDLIEVLRRHGYGEAELLNLGYRNWLRVWDESTNSAAGRRF